ncbi:DMT family transporter [Streptomyces sp. PR69]|uniref:DMT family transporter n=1 Tax=Streptomyces sp. PR69 TaxID=2984950 RepID=UPI002263DBC4|nr:DMT family transporter [Streptomyces sp. PR69]
MGIGLLFALGAAVCMGTATVLQAMGARRAAEGASAAGLGTVLLALRRWPFVAGVGLDMVGFAAELAALRAAPIFTVEAALASSLAVTAVVAAVVLRIRLRRVEVAAVAAVCCGLALLALAAGREGEGEGDLTLRLGALGASAALALAGWTAGRWVRRGRAVALGGVAGLSFGVVAVSARMLPDLEVPGVFAEPTAYAVALSGITGFLFLIDALQAGAVTAVTAAMVIGETVWPALFGVVWLGDTTRPGLAPLAVAGFALSIAGALALARFGEAEQHAPAG